MGARTADRLIARGGHLAEGSRCSGLLSWMERLGELFVCNLAATWLQPGCSLAAACLLLVCSLNEACFA